MAFLADTTSYAVRYSLNSYTKCDSPLSRRIGEAQFRPDTEIAPKSPFLSGIKYAQCCKLRQHIVAQSRPEFYFLQQTFNFIFCVTTCYASQHLWLVNFPPRKARERWWVSARLTSGKFWAGTKWPVWTSAICGLWKFYRSSAFLANYMRKIMWLLIKIHTVIALQ